MTPTRLYLPALPEAPGLARRFTTRTLRAWQAPTEAIQSAEIVVSELVTNAQRTSGPDADHPDGHPDRCGPGGPGGPGAAECIVLTLRPLPGRVAIEVTDHAPGPPVLAEPALDAEGGRGLILVQALSERWGHRRQTSGGKTVYAVIGTGQKPGQKPG